VAVGGCGGAVAPAQEPASGAAAESPAAPAPPAFGVTADDVGAETLAEAFVDLDQAERKLESALGLPGGGTAGASPALESPERQVEAPAPRTETPLSQGPSSAERCEVACDAFGSMQRAAGRLCELAGPDDPRCVRAGERLERARSLVRSSCPSCEP
jgi:hypothetical protein